MPKIKKVKKGKKVKKIKKIKKVVEKKIRNKSEKKMKWFC